MNPANTPTPETSCPCGSGKTLRACCQLYLSGQSYPRDAETLMRSRYSAFVHGDLNYLQKSWHPDTCPDLCAKDLDTNWVRLEVLKSRKGLKKSVVEFKAWYRQDGQERALHEISLFRLYRKRWVYVEPLPGWP